jgi:hypothetical protein
MTSTKDGIRRHSIVKAVVLDWPPPDGHAYQRDQGSLPYLEAAAPPNAAGSIPGGIQGVRH